MRSPVAAEAAKAASARAVTAAVGLEGLPARMKRSLGTAVEPAKLAEHCLWQAVPAAKKLRMFLVDHP